MISLNNVTKFYPSKLGDQYIFDQINFSIPAGHNIAILGANGAGKSTLFRLLAGSEYPNKGKIVTDLSISWPVALSTGIHPEMTGRENTRFIGRVNGVKNLKEYENKVRNFAELAKKYDLPVKSYSSGMRAKLAFACCISIDFDVYLIDEATSVGDAKFKRKAKQALLRRSENANVIMVSHDLKEIRQFCDSAIILNNGQLAFYNDLESAIECYQEL
ncbi:ATP-binding cassette domain-containing protein [Agarivorans sp. B2Z047]|uniref:ABC transporter ATP-binding protein n=1 Tax=Agarivorans sp. B2Z047 TaxID=2652721 RepID=UPI001406AD61|nr:ABC transporter ATP-binding protein [Agarivorans sp. B2Z047]MPW28749.1 ATP-binding cassette domain-containing protein [Agarivorans sp. B2Z047]UQN41310.1 ABC transporter ATP-binding protein [Agarivorans sp. B2Z047]